MAISKSFVNRRPFPGDANNYGDRTYDVAATRGTPVGVHTTDKTKLILAAPNNFKGFLGREVTVGGPALVDHLMPVVQEFPIAAGQLVPVIIPPLEIELGTEFILESGTGAITSATSVPQKLSFIGGKARIAQSGDDVEYRLVAQIDPLEGENTRIRCERV